MILSQKNAAVAGIGFIGPVHVEALRRLGVEGVGQSSWGPTGFVFAQSESEGQSLLESALTLAGGAELLFELAQGRNAPATIEIR